MVKFIVFGVLMVMQILFCIIWSRFFKIVNRKDYENLKYWAYRNEDEYLSN